MNRYKGVELSSRYELEAEFAEMMRVVDALSPLLLSRVQQIWCDSKAGACYAVTMRAGPWDDSFATGIHAVFMTQGGHNGIAIQGGPREIFIEPEWEGDELDDPDR
ncbi:hypothetical protein [Novosphingobium clariflavum]|uniref:Uncharacterized protein n=1 Tax=Novosphingobium clariflavum TaxID=2029884 RepID=A0ABV6S1F9_9SPHN|nr:hypothetical protein [Novosphingobium clariflavum]